MPSARFTPHLRVVLRFAQVFRNLSRRTVHCRVLYLLRLTTAGRFALRASAHWAHASLRRHLRTHFPPASGPGRSIVAEGTAVPSARFTPHLRVANAFGVVRTAHPLPSGAFTQGRQSLASPHFPHPPIPNQSTHTPSPLRHEMAQYTGFLRGLAP